MIKAMGNNQGSIKLKPIHPGDILKTEFLEPLKLKGEELAQNIQVEEQTILDLLEEKTKITAEIAYRLSCYFQVNPELFLNLQQRYDLKVLEQEQGEQIKQVIKPYPRKEISRKTF